MNQRDHEYDDDQPLEGETEDEMFARRERHRQSSRVVSDFVKRAIENTVGQVQSSGAIPKDAFEYLVKQGDKGRREVVRIVANEVGDFLKQTDLSSEAIKVLTNLQVDFNATVKFKRNPEGRLSTEVAEDTSVTLSGKAPEPDPEAPAEDEEGTP